MNYTQVVALSVAIEKRGSGVHLLEFRFCSHKRSAESLARLLGTPSLSFLTCPTAITTPTPKGYEEILVDNSHKALNTVPGPDAQEALPSLSWCHLGRTKSPLKLGNSRPWQDRPTSWVLIKASGLWFRIAKSHNSASMCPVTLCAVKAAAGQTVNSVQQ